MSIGVSLFLIAVGAILRWAVTDTLNWIDLETVGLILLVVGIIGMLLSLMWMFMQSDGSRPGGGSHGPPPGPPPPR